MKRKIYRLTSLVHKWAGLVLAVQLLFWILGGLVMSAIPLENVHGTHLAQRNLDSTLTNQDYQFPIRQLLGEAKHKINNIKLIDVLGQPYYLLQSEHGMTAIHGLSGKPLNQTSQTQAEQIAKRHYLGKAEITEISLLQEVPLEASANQAPVWRVTFDDTWRTTLYIANQSAQLTTIRSDIWRIFDFFWMLHIMDYDQRNDFNNPLLIAFAAAALVFTISGIILLLFSFRVGKRLGKLYKRLN